MEVSHEVIGIVGKGRMARALGALLAPVVFTGTSVFDYQHILIAVTDDAIPSVAVELAESGLTGAIVLHTSGAAGPDALSVLRDAGNSVGVLHPLQTVPSAERGVETLPGATYAFAGDAPATEWARRLISRLEGKALEIDPRYWPHYHSAAVMACNYQVTLMDSALELMEKAGIARPVALDALGPILRATTENILQAGPERALTGPIVRGDAGTLRGHLAALESAMPETRNLYIAAGLRTLPIAARAGLAQQTAEKLARVLTGKE